MAVVRLPAEPVRMRSWPMVGISFLLPADVPELQTRTIMVSVGEQLDYFY